MMLSEAISLHAKGENWLRFAVFVWEEGDYLVAEVDGIEYRASNMFSLDSRLTDAGVPGPRNLYFVDEKPEDEALR